MHRHTQPGVPMAHLELANLLMTNLLHSGIALLWLLGLRRFAGPLAPTLWADLLRICLGLPPALLLLRVLGLPQAPLAWRTLRVGRWTELALDAGPLLLTALVALLAGTLLLFVVQELRPALLAWRDGVPRDALPDAQLQADAESMLELLRNHNLVPSRGRPPEALHLPNEQPIAGLRGIVRPQVVASTGLLTMLDREERLATLAHELAHWARGGNLRLLLVWLLRSTQAANPAALILFRELVEAEELACDFLAARVTGRPAALASALLKAHGQPELQHNAGPLARAQAEVLRRAELSSVRARVERLLRSPPQRVPHWAITGGAVAVLVVLLWSVG